MRVLAVTTWYPSSSNPTEAPFNHEHVKAIGLRHSVRVVHVRLHSKGSPRSSVYDGVDVLTLPVSLGRPWSFARAALRLLREARSSDLVHTMAFSSALVMAPVWTFLRLPWVHTEHWNGVSNPSSVGPLWEKFAWSRHVLRLPHRVTGVTQQLADSLQKFSRTGAASVVPCVVNNTRPIVPRSSSGTLRLVAVGGLQLRKRPYLALETIRRLVDMDINVEYEWVGGGPLESDVRTCASRLGIADRVHFAGSVHPAQVLERIEGADLFFLPSAQENFFTAAAEALSADRPVVAALVGGYDDYCTSENSVLVKEPNAESLSQAILEARDRLLPMPIGALAEPIRVRFSPDSVSLLFDGIYGAATRRAVNVASGR
ncbi:glycosyltransferase [Arthrobacter sp. D2-10]